MDWEHFDIHLPLTPCTFTIGGRRPQRRHPRKSEGILTGMAIYAFWNIWKERNRRIFNNVSETALQTASREDIMLRKRAIDRLA